MAYLGLWKGLRMKFYNRDIERLSIDDVCSRIHFLTKEMMDFWENAHGWAPIDAAGLMSKSMLEWQSALSGCLSKWLPGTTPGELILAWANLGSLVEGQLKLFLSVWYNDYAADAEAIKKKGKLQDPDILTLEGLRQFFVKRIWDNSDIWDKWIRHIQEKRNAIHVFRHRDIGTFDIWRQDLRNHLAFVRDINSRLPYPDETYVPREI